MSKPETPQNIRNITKELQLAQCKFYTFILA
jgi:hypothetical protein